MPENAETYDTTSGLMDDFDCEVLDAWFATDPRYNNGQTALLFWKIATDDPENPEDENSRWATGADWESLDGGKTVEHPKGKTKFNKNSAYGMLIDRAVQLGAGEALASKGPSQVAEVWVGLKFHMKREKDEYTIQGETKSREVLLPSAYLGVGDGSGPEVGTTDAAPSEPAFDLSTLDDGMVETLRKIKTDTPSHMAFVDQAMELTDVTSNANLVMALATPDGLWKEL